MSYTFNMFSGIQGVTRGETCTGILGSSKEIPRNGKTRKLDTKNNG